VLNYQSVPMLYCLVDAAQQKGLPAGSEVNVWQWVAAF